METVQRLCATNDVRVLSTVKVPEPCMLFRHSRRSAATFCFWESTQWHSRTVFKWPSEICSKARGKKWMSYSSLRSSWVFFGRGWQLFSKSVVGCSHKVEIKKIILVSARLLWLLASLTVFGRFFFSSSIWFAQHSEAQKTVFLLTGPAYGPDDLVKCLAPDCFLCMQSS